MKSISSLSKYLGCYDLWKQIIQRYQLKWSTENSLDSFNHIWDNKKDYSSMLSWIKETYSKLPRDYGNILLYCTLTGLRPDEACKSLQLIHTDINRYLNKETRILEHFRYHENFIRRTKKAYISIITNNILKIAKESGNYSYNSVRMKVRTNNMNMKMSYCRKVFATHLRNGGIQAEIIDLLQRRIPKSIFVRNYYRPDSNYVNKIRVLLDQLGDTILG